MPRVIAEFANRRIVRASSRRDTVLHLEKKGEINAMGEQQWISMTHCQEYPERGGTDEGEERETVHLLRYVSSLVPRTEADK